MMIYTPYIWPLIFSGTLLIATGFYIRRFKEAPAVLFLSLCMWIGALWSFDYAIALSTPYLPTRITLGNFSIVFALGVVFCSFGAVLEYTGKRAWLTRNRIIGMLAVSCLIIILAFTSTTHTLFRYHFSVNLNHQFAGLQFSTGPLFLVYVGYLLFVNISCLFLLFSTAMVRRQDAANLFLLSLAILFPFTYSIIYLVGLSPVPGLDFSPMLQVLSAIFYIAALASSRWLDVTFIARDLVIDHVADLVLVFDARHHLVGLNRAARASLGLTENVFKARKFTGLPDSWLEAFGKYNDMENHQEEVILSFGNYELIYDLSVTPILDDLQRLQGRLFLLHDITRLKDIQNGLLESEEKFRRLAETSAAGMYIFDGAHFITINPAFVKITGFSEQELICMDPMDLFHPDEKEALRERASARLRGENVPQRYEIRSLTKSGEERWVDLSTGVITYRGKPASLGTFFDITERRFLEQELRASHELYLNIVEGQDDLICRWLPDTTLTFVNNAYCNYFGVPKEGMVGTRFVDSLPPKTQQIILGSINTLMNREAKTVSTEEVNVSPEGLKRWVVWVYHPIFSQDGKIVGFQSVGHDITDRKRAELALQKANTELAQQLDKNWILQEQLQEQAIRDPLTGLFNRRYLQETLEREIAAAERIGYTVSLIMLDVDDFKIFNDTYGHIAGDLILQSVGVILREHTRQMDVACRFGGEEFLVFLPTIPASSAALRAELLCKSIEDLALDSNGESLHITISAGVASYPDNAIHAEALLIAVDRALYAAKKAGRNCVAVSKDQPPRI